MLEVVSSCNRGKAVLDDWDKFKIKVLFDRQGHVPLYCTIPFDSVR